MRKQFFAVLVAISMLLLPVGEMAGLSLANTPTSPSLPTNNAPSQPTVQRLNSNPNVTPQLAPRQIKSDKNNTSSTLTPSNSLEDKKEAKLKGLHDDYMAFLLTAHAIIRNQNYSREAKIRMCKNGCRRLCGRYCRGLSPEAQKRLQEQITKAALDNAVLSEKDLAWLESEAWANDISWQGDSSWLDEDSWGNALSDEDDYSWGNDSDWGDDSAWGDWSDTDWGDTYLDDWSPDSGSELLDLGW